MATRPRQRPRKAGKPGRLLDDPAVWDGATVAASARYVGSGKHKTYPPPDGSDLWEPVWPNDGSAERCERYDREAWSNLERLLRAAIASGFVSSHGDGTPDLAFDGFPRRAWAWIGETLQEARYTQNREYHAYPLTRPACWPSDPGARLAEAPRWNP